MNAFGKRSKANLATCHKDLQLILHLAIKRSKVDFGISCGNRSLEEQQRLYKEGKTTINGTTKIGMHNHSPSLAADIYIYNSDPVIRKKLLYDQRTLCYVMGVIESCAIELHEQKFTTHIVRLGINWDMDGIILHDQKFDDYPHVEIRKK